MLNKFSKGKCVPIRVEILHMSKFKPETVDKNLLSIIGPPSEGLCDAGTIL